MVFHAIGNAPMNDLIPEHGQHATCNGLLIQKAGSVCMVLNTGSSLM